MPYPASKSIGYVGKVIPDYLKQKWTLISLPDKPGIRVSVKKNLEKFDLAHYDSDKSYIGRQRTIKKILPFINKNGLLFIDDIQDNCFFYDLIRKKD